MNVVCEIMYKEEKKNYIYTYSGLMTEKDVVFMSYSSSYVKLIFFFFKKVLWRHIVLWPFLMGQKR